MPKQHESMSFFDFQKRYPDDAACEQKLYSFRWPHGLNARNADILSFMISPSVHYSNVKNVNIERHSQQGL